MGHRGQAHMVTSWGTIKALGKTPSATKMGEREDCLKTAAHTLPTTECDHINNALSKDDRVQALLYGQAHGDNVGHRGHSW